MFTVTNETDMLVRNPKASLSTFCDLRDTQLHSFHYFFLVSKPVDACMTLADGAGIFLTSITNTYMETFISPKLFM